MSAPTNALRHGTIVNMHTVIYTIELLVLATAGSAAGSMLVVIRNNKRR
jgi:hypothetical protein